MFKRHRLLGLIPARKNSKGLPGKNMRPCAGRPLVEWTIEAAARSACLDSTIVSTDWPEVAQIARRHKLDVKMRPTELASDYAPLIWVLKDAWRDGYDYAVVLQATSPTRTAEQIDRAIEHYFAQRATEQDTLASVCEVQKAGWLMERGRIEKSGKGGYVNFCFDPKPNRQALTTYYKPTGAIFILSQPFEFYRRCIPFPMPDGVDIDTEADLLEAEGILARRYGTLNLMPA